MKTFEKAVEAVPLDDKFVANLLSQNDHTECGSWLMSMISVKELFGHLRAEHGEDFALKQCLHIAFTYGQLIGMEMEKP